MTSTELKDWMAAHGYSVRRLADVLGVAPASVQRWRDGSTPPPPWLHLALAGVTLDSP